MALAAVAGAVGALGGVAITLLQPSAGARPSNVPLRAAALLALALLGGACLGVLVAARHGAASRRSKQGADAPVSGGDSDTRSPGHTAASNRGMSEIGRKSALGLDAPARAARELDGAVRDIHAALGGDEVVVWQWDEAGERLLPLATSGAESPTPVEFRMDEWGPIVRWAVETIAGQVDDRSGVACLAAVPVMEEGAALGALSVSAANGFGIPRAALLSALDRHARHVGAVVGLAEVRAQHARYVRQSEGLLDAVRRLQEHDDPEGLIRALCQGALHVSTASRVSLLRWQDGTGVVAFSTDVAVPAGAAVSPQSLAAEGCRTSRGLLLANAAVAAAGAPVLGVGEDRSETGSLAVVPLAREQHVLGALVVEGRRVGSIDEEAARNVRVLAAIGSSTLPVVWEMEEVTRRSRTDALTGLWNRRYLDEQLARILAETDRYGGTASLILVDVDHFKQVNDVHGHEAGDATLRQVARVLADRVREVDVCARFGGEELAIILPQTSSGGAIELAERLRRAVEGTVVTNAYAPIQVTASFGVAAYPETVSSRERVFAAADRALYRAKADGRNCVRSA